MPSQLDCIHVMVLLADRITQGYEYSQNEEKLLVKLECIYQDSTDKPNYLLEVIKLLQYYKLKDKKVN